MANFDSAGNAITIDSVWKTYGTIPIGFRPYTSININYVGMRSAGLVNFNAAAIQFIWCVGNSGSVSYVRAFVSYVTKDPFPS